MADPDALHNLIADPKLQAEIAQMRQQLLIWMERTQDPLVEKFRSLAAVKPKS
jgi:hypothetical protein